MWERHPEFGLIGFIMSMKGLKHTEEWKRWASESRSGEKNPFFGKTHSSETRRKMSIARRKRVISVATREKMSRSLSGKNNPMYGKSLSLESRKKLSDSLKGKYCGKNHPMYGRHHSEESKLKMSESHMGLQCGENHPNWKKGISFEPYCPKFNREFKSRVRAFFGNMCLLCGKTKEENGQNMGVHHVNYEKMVCCSDIEPIFACLCKSCHPKTNHNREYWEEFLTNKINEEYNGKSFYTKEEYREILLKIDTNSLVTSSHGVLA